MGVTRFAGPVYGAKSLLKTLGPITGAQNTSTAAAFTNASWTVPNYQDWFVTEVGLSVSTCSSSPQSFLLKSEGGSTTIPARNGPGNGSTIAQTLTSFANAPTTSTSIGYTMNTLTPTAGEYEGIWVPAGSTMRFVSSCASAPGNLSVDIYGYIRYIDSTRSV
jgi:hypothetical protein